MIIMSIGQISIELIDCITDLMGVTFRVISESLHSEIINEPVIREVFYILKDCRFIRGINKSDCN